VVAAAERPAEPAAERSLDLLRQHGHAWRFDWGPSGLRALAPHADVVVIVDVLRFTTAVSAAVEAGATVLPYRWADDGAAAFARERHAVLAGRREDGGPSLSPTDLLSSEPGTRLVLPSPNGSALAFAARDHGARHVLAGSLRNAGATARRAAALAPDGVVAVIAAGERWHGATGPIRLAVEDLLGSGAVLAALDPSSAVAPPACSPEAAAARAAFVAARPLLHDALAQSGSGRDLIARGWDDDVATAAALDVSPWAAELRGDEFVRA
jgi:2-phosphosulfolactate phosphatase